MGSVSQELGESTIIYQFSTHFYFHLGKLYPLLFTEDGMSVSSLEREMEVMGITARERVLRDPDMLDIIFSFLDEQSISRVGLVSRLWMSVSESPKFWTKSIRRVETTSYQAEIIFHKIANCENLKLTGLNISGSDLSSVPVDVLVEAISRLENIDLYCTKLTPDQAQS